MKRPLRLAVGFAMAIAFLAMTSTLAVATSNARLTIARSMLNIAGTNDPDVGTGDLNEVLRVYKSAGVDISGWNSRGDVLKSAAPIVPITQPEPSGPAPGDLIAYNTQPGDPVPVRLGMFVTNNDVIVYNALSQRFDRVLRLQISGEAQQPNDTQYAQAGSALAYRVVAARWPGGNDDTSIPPGKVSLVDPQKAADSANWASEHPRDPDTSLWHRAERSALNGLALASSVLATVVGSVLNAGHWLLQRLPVAGPLALLVFGVLGRTFDGTGLHRLLITTVMSVFPPLGLLFLGASLADKAGVPGAGAVARGLSGFAGFVVTMVTGIEANGRSSVGGVVIALGSDLLAVGKPFAAGAKAAAEGMSVLSRLRPLASSLTIARDVGRGFVFGRFGVANIASNMADSVMLRPTTWNAVGHWLVSGRAAKAGLAMQSADIASLAWRPGSVLSDSVGHVAAAFHAAENGHVPQVLAKSVQWIVDTNVGPAVHAVSTVTHFHSGGSAVTRLATGQSPQTVVPPRRLRPHELLRRMP